MGRLASGFYWHWLSEQQLKQLLSSEQVNSEDGKVKSVFVLYVQPI